MSASALFEVFVGRTAELDQLLAGFELAGAHDQGKTILISGESGVGKSRLLREFARRLDSRRHVFLLGQCLEYVLTPYGALIDAFKNDRSGQVIAHALRDSEERRGSIADEKASRFAQVRDAIKRRSAVSGVLILAIEDLQWSDAALLDLLRYLTYELRDAPVLILATFRTEDVEQRPPIAAAIAKLTREGAKEIAVLPLSDESIARAVHSTIRDLHPIATAAVSMICQLSEGRPMVAEELLRGILDGPRTQAVPGLRGLRAALLDRLAQFDHEQQQLLMQAAVIGREFDLQLLSHLSDEPQDAILLTLRLARNAQLLVEHSAPEKFAFRHAITREVLHRELLAHEVRTLHRKIAAALEDLEPQARADEIAYHWWAASEPERAVTSNTAAGDRAARMFANADAARFYEHALDFASENSDERLALLEKVTRAICTQGDLPRARAFCEQAAREAEALGRAAESHALTLWLARQLHESGDSREALATIESVITAEEDNPRSPVLFAAQMTKAAVLALQGSAEEALSLLDATLDANDDGDPTEQFRGENARGNALSSLGRYEEAIAAYRRALSIAKSLESTELLLHAWNSLAGVALQLGRATEAVVAYETAWQVAAERGFRRMELFVAAGLAFAHLCAGQLSHVRALIAQYGRDRSGSAAPRVFMQGVAIRLAALELGDTYNREMLERAAEAAFSSENETLIEIVAGAIAYYELACGHNDQACAISERALYVLSAPDFGYWLFDVASICGAPSSREAASALLDKNIVRGATAPAIAYRHLLDARRAMDSGKPTEAKALALQAHQTFSSFPWPYEAAQALELAGDDERALAIYVQMGAPRQVARLQDKLGKRRTPDGAKTALTRREEQVGVLVRRGYSNRAVAEELHIGERTVETHVASMYRKLGVKSRVELASRLEQGAVSTYSDR